MCVRTCKRKRNLPFVMYARRTHTHTHTDTLYVYVYVKPSFVNKEHSSLHEQAVIIPATNKDNIWEKMAANILKCRLLVLVSMSLAVSFSSVSASRVFAERISFYFILFPSYKKMALTFIWNFIWMSAFVSDAIFNFEKMYRTTFIMRERENVRSHSRSYLLAFYFIIWSKIGLNAPQHPSFSWASENSFIFTECRIYSIILKNQSQKYNVK